MKKDGKLIIETGRIKIPNIPYTLHVKNEKVSKEVDRWVKKLKKENSIIQNVENLIIKISNNRKRLMNYFIVWGLQSLERESKEEYNIHDYLEKIVCSNR